MTTEEKQLEKAVAAFTKIGKELGVIKQLIFRGLNASNCFDQ